MRRPISSRVHGVLDYLTGSGLIAASLLPPVRDRLAGRALRAGGAAHLAYSLVTDYEHGVVRKLPYGAHLVLDALGACAAAALGATRSEPIDRFVLAGVGLYELSAVALSDPTTNGTRTSASITVDRPVPEVEAFLRSPENVRRFSPDGDWPGEFDLRAAPGGRGTEIHAQADPADMRRAKQLLEAGEIATATGPSGRRGVLSSRLPTLDSGTR